MFILFMQVAEPRFIVLSITRSTCWDGTPGIYLPYN